MLMALRGVSKRFGLRTILHRVACSVAEGERLLLVGGNGAGKSTLLRLMAGLCRPTEGEVDNACTAQELGYVGHGTCQYPGLSALENVQFWCDLYALPANAADRMDMLRRVGLGRFVHERAGTFSRGMAQRLNLARVFLQKPRLMLLDEPGTGLDAGALSLLHAEVDEAARRGAGVVWISHDIKTALPLVDRVLVIRDRTLAFDGSVADYQDLEPQEPQNHQDQREKAPC